MNPPLEKSVTFDIGLLAQLALAQASKMPCFKGDDLFSEPVYSDHGGDCFEGIKVTNRQPKESDVC